MPRIELEYSDDEFETIDICNRCASDYYEGASWELPDGTAADVSDMDVCRPEYDDGWGDYTCEKCNKKLTEKNAGG